MDEKSADLYLQSRGWGTIPPQTYLIDLEPEFLKFWERVKEYTLISVERAYAIYQSTSYCIQKGIPGDFVECGVWKGGASMLAALCFLHLDASHKNLWLYDTFEGMTTPQEEDVIAASGQPVSERNPEGWWAVSLDEVKQNLQTTDYPEGKMNFIKGDVQLTLERAKPDRISILRLDTDWYQSTKKELEVLFPLLETGGVLLIDDYGHFEGARKAVDEYFREQGLFPLLQRVDYTGRLWIKS